MTDGEVRQIIEAVTQANTTIRQEVAAGFKQTADAQAETNLQLKETNGRLTALETFRIAQEARNTASLKTSIEQGKELATIQARCSVTTHRDELDEERQDKQHAWTRGQIVRLTLATGGSAAIIGALMSTLF